MTRQKFIDTIIGLKVGQYIDVIFNGDDDEPKFIFTKKVVFGKEVILYDYIQTGEIGVIQDDLMTGYTVDDKLIDFWDEYDQDNTITLGEPFYNRDWDGDEV